MEPNIEYLEEVFADLRRTVISQQNTIEENNKIFEKKVDSFFNDVLSVLDAFEKAEEIIKERELDKDENSQKIIKRFLSAKKKVVSLLNNNSVSEITFENGLMRDSDCLVTDTEPDSSKPEGSIISIEKKGYKRGERLLRPAEVIIVRN
jgi:molecular chaperone GrpE (heat shock protein)